MAVTALEPDAWFGGDRPDLTAALLGIEDRVDDLVGINPIMADNRELGEGLVRLAQIKAKLCAAETAMLGVFDTRRVFHDDGSRSTAAWLAARTPTPRNVIQRLVRLARRLRRMPLTRQALQGGDRPDPCRGVGPLGWLPAGRGA